MTNAGALTLVARIVRPFGIKGEVKALIETDFPERLVERKNFFVTSDEKLTGEIRDVASIRFHKGTLLVKFVDVDSVDDAELLRGKGLAIPTSERPELRQDTFWMDEIIGMRVVTEEGRELGAVTEILRGKANDAWVTPVAIIPAVKEVVVRVDTKQREVIVREVEGLELQGGL